MCMGHGSSPLTSRAAASCTGRLLSTNHESGRRIIYFSFRMNFSPSNLYIGVSPCQSIDTYISVNQLLGPVDSSSTVVRILASFCVFLPGLNVTITRPLSSLMGALAIARPDNTFGPVLSLLEFC